MLRRRPRYSGYRSMRDRPRRRFSQRRGDATERFYSLYSAIQKFAEKIRRRNSDKKNKLSEPRKSGASFCFSGISETNQANFCWALIFWSFLIKQKGHKSFFGPSKSMSRRRPRYSGYRSMRDRSPKGKP
jgi:hypothetical protein